MDDQAEGGHTEFVLAGRRRRGRGISSATLRLRASDGSSVDMKSDLPELTALSLLAAFCCGLAWARGDTFFAVVFSGASAMTIIEAIRGLR